MTTPHNPDDDDAPAPPLTPEQKQVADLLFMYAYGHLPVPYPYSSDENGEPRLKYGIFIRPDSIHPDYKRVMDERASNAMASRASTQDSGNEVRSLGLEADTADPAQRYLSHEHCARLLQQWVYDELRHRGNIPSFDAKTIQEGVYESYLLRQALAHDFTISLDHIKPTAIAGAMFHYYWFWVALRRKHFTPLIEIRTPHRRAEYLQALLALAATREDWTEKVLD
ncbi:MAG: hypothetical protein EAZ30_02650 [Betaproteobacteria bacterium]|nr:MAG: hypothetical protein EAZ30_02650 [Betaproteobacteria bacterium]